MSDISSSSAVTRMMAPAVMAQEGLDRAARPRQGNEAGKQSEKPRGDLLSFSAAASSVLAGANASEPLTQNAVLAPNPNADVSADPADKGVVPQQREKAAPASTSAEDGEELRTPNDNAHKGTGRGESEDEGGASHAETAPGFPSSPAEEAAANMGRTHEERSADAASIPGGDIPQPKPLPAPEAAAAKVMSTRAERREVDKYSPAASCDSEACNTPLRPPAPSPAGSVIDLQS